MLRAAMLLSVLIMAPGAAFAQAAAPEPKTRHGPGSRQGAPAELRRMVASTGTARGRMSGRCSSARRP